MENDLKTLIHKRGLVKGQLTRFKTFLETNKNNYNQISARVKNIESLLSEFFEIQTKIELLESKESDEVERGSFEDAYYTIITEAREIISSLEVPDSTLNIGQDLSQVLHQSRTTQQDVQVRLPIINLPTFSGSYDEWQSFSESFQSLIHQNTSLSDVHKFYYLKSCLKGEAADILLSLEASTANYPIAWSLLKDRFENTRLIINSYVSALFSFTKIDGENAHSIRIFLDHVNKNVRALNALGQPTDYWDTLLIHLTLSKLPKNTIEEWEKVCKPKCLPTFSELLVFLENRYQTLQSLETQFKPLFLAIKPKMNTKAENPISKTTTAEYKNRKPYNQSTFTSTDSSMDLCKFCEGSHKLFACDLFLKLSIQNRIEKVKSLGLCLNCLKSDGHKAFNCKSGNCKVCARKHNTLLHIHKETISQGPSAKARFLTNKQLTNEEVDNPKPISKVNTITDTHSSHTSSSSNHILLPTAIVNVEDSKGNLFPCRVLLDSASQCNFISEHMTQILKLKKEKVYSSVTGISQTTTNISKLIRATIRSRTTSYVTSLDFLVLSKITVDLPSVPIDVSNWKIPPHVELADPNCHKPNKIDMLLGAEVFMELLCSVESKGEQSYPTLTETKLGWVVSGKSKVQKLYSGGNRLSNSCHFVKTNNSLDMQLQRFWQLEEVTPFNDLSGEDLLCEEHFKKTTTRDASGRYTVSMPFKESSSELGESYNLAKKRFEQIEKRFKKHPDLKAEYSKFIDEYLELNHMEEANEEDNDLVSSYFIPHHAVFKESSTTTKLRVVFDCSAKTSNGISLNDILSVGPCIQQDLFSIITRFRTHNYALNADIEKMYRQINIDPAQRKFLKILWRNRPSEPLKTYKLKTVTYGSACAPFLATRTLHQLAQDEAKRFPLASSILTRDFYMDDLLTGCNSPEESVQLQKDLNSLLKEGGFKLRKWTSNKIELIKHIPKEDIEFKGDFNQEQSTKTLGLLWNAASDKFHYSVKGNQKLQFISKRHVLSEISKIFDPLGLISPIIIQAKMFMQRLWQYNLQWDDSLPEVEREYWNTFTERLQDLNHVEVSRRVLKSNQSQVVQVHGFCDSSEKAYGACLYIRQEDIDGNVSIRLLCSKSRVAPIKKVTLPRLELCAALLLSRLVHKVLQILNLSVQSCILWSDSTIVLSWLNSPSSRWKTFVANRVAEIQNLTKDHSWQHVRSNDNPADLVSRGTNPTDLMNSKLWWHGPDWLKEHFSIWSCLQIQPEEDNCLEERKITVTTTVDESFINDISNRYSSFIKLQRVIAFCLRFANNIKKSNDKRFGSLTVNEMERSHNILIKLVQQQELKEDMKNLQNSKPVSNKSKLKFLHPFLDKDSLIRVGGRLQHSTLNFDQKHQLVLPTHKISQLIAEQTHKTNLHIGPQQLLAEMRQRYWPINGRNLVRKLCRECIRCFKVNPKSANQEMGSLPRHRVEANRAFVNTGVDYCGPVYLRSKTGRGGTTIKAFIAIFVCLAVKAIHIELVQDLSSEAFIAALKRFIARRGKVSHIYSDNATNFVGANNELKELKDLFESELQSVLVDEFSSQNIEWHFNPPNSPHFGGLWEAAVKSTKYHIKRVAANSLLTYDEMHTLLTQIEACLNSRPITPMSDNPSDYSYLTPGHFLVGEALTAIPEPDLTPLKMNRLSRWQRVQQMFQHFWDRWSIEYLSSLQTRTKWNKEENNVRVGDLVLLQDINLPPLKWRVGRIVETFPGKDHKIRVVSVRTATGVLKRAIASLCIFPRQDLS